MRKLTSKKPVTPLTPRQITVGAMIWGVIELIAFLGFAIISGLAAEGTIQMMVGLWYAQAALLLCGFAILFFYYLVGKRLQVALTMLLVCLLLYGFISINPVFSQLAVSMRDINQALAWAITIVLAAWTAAVHVTSVLFPAIVAIRRKSQDVEKIIEYSCVSVAIPPFYLAAMHKALAPQVTPEAEIADSYSS